MSRPFPGFSPSSFVRVNGLLWASPHRCPFRIHASLRSLGLVGFGVLFADPAAIAQVFFRLGHISYAGIWVPVPTEALQGRLSGLPDGVLVERDRIEVRFSSATEAVKAVCMRWLRRW